MKGIFQAAFGASLLIAASPFILGMVVIKAVQQRMVEKELEKKGIKKFYSKEFNLNVWDFRG